jgi:hypothetical protein
VELRCAIACCDWEQDGVKTMRVARADPTSRVTLHFESIAVAVIGACRSPSQAADLLGLHWNSVQRIIEEAVNCGLARRSLDGLSLVGLDDKS